jgi:predicted ATPase
VGYDQSVVEWCSSRDLLLVLDNCEHVLRGAESLVSSLLASAPGVKVLATSREPLMATGEHVVPVPSLALDGSGGEISEAVEFFVERAHSELPDFDAAGQEELVGDICARLDGIPLALELAASRVRGLSIPEISRRLDERFRLLTGGRSGSVERHATLRATVDWSYDLLEPDGQDLFERLTVFAGRFTVDDAIGLRGDDADEFEVIDTLTALVDRSLVVREDQPPEYRMLETLRAYGRERLALHNRIDHIRADHATLMAAKAKGTRASAAGPLEGAVTTLLEAQLPDYGAAADWAIGAGRPELAVAIAEDCLLAHWGIEEPGRWIAPLIDSDQAETSWMAGALAIAAFHASFFESDPHRGAELAHHATVLDPQNALAYTQACIAAIFTGQQDTVVEHAEKARETASDDKERHVALLVLGHALLITGRLEEAAGVARDLERLGHSCQYR